MVSKALILLLISNLYKCSQSAYTSISEDQNKSHIWNSLANQSIRLEHIDQTLQQLQEKSNTWTIFRHNIDAWSEQLKLIEQKLSLIKYTQDAQDDKLMSLEVLVNQALSKIMLLNVAEQPLGGTVNKKQKHEQLDKHQMVELSARLQNVLRHLQHFEHGNKFNGTKLLTGSDHFDKVLWKLEQKLNILVTNMKPKDVKQMQLLTKKNAQNMDNITVTLTELVDLHKNGIKNWDQMTDYCQGISAELTTFTESSDLLLKRIELLVKNLSDKLKPNITQSTIDENNCDESTEDSIEQQTESSCYDDETAEPEETFETAEFVQPEKSDCAELFTPRFNGIYKFQAPQINAAGRDFNERFCVFATDGPAWTVIQNRGPYLEQENFNRTWHEYSVGFGSLSKDFWYGNEFIHILSNGKNYELRIELQDFEGVEAWAEYRVFRLENEFKNYKLIINEYSGSIPNAFLYHSNTDFSTFDRQHTQSDAEACASSYGSGWWFKSCFEANLNGKFRTTPKGNNFSGIIWEPWHGDYSLKTARMLIRPLIKTDKSNNVI